MLRLLRREKTTTEKNFLVLDIGTDTVKALVCEVQDRRAKVTGVGTCRQKLGDMHSGAVMDIASVIENCSTALVEACKQAGSSPTDVMMGIAGELVKGLTTRTTHVRKEPGTKMDLNELKNIIHKVEWKAFEETRGQLAYETGLSEIDIKLVNAAVLDVRIDGYRVTNPIGFQGKEVQISMFNAFAPLVHFGALQTIAAELDLNLIGITAEPYALSRCLESFDESVTPLSAIFIDVGAGTTDIAVVQNGCLEGTKMFTIGGRSFTKRLAATLAISFDEAEAIKRAYSSGKLEKQSTKIVREAMESDVEVWIAGVALSLSEFPNLDRLPPKILLCGGCTHLPEIPQALGETNWSAQLQFSRPPTVELLSPRSIETVFDATKQLTDCRDVTPLALAHIGVEFVTEDDLLSKILKKVIRLMQL